MAKLREVLFSKNYSIKNCCNLFPDRSESSVESRICVLQDHAKNNTAPTYKTRFHHNSETDAALLLMSGEKNYQKEDGTPDFAKIAKSSAFAVLLSLNKKNATKVALY